MALNCYSRPCRCDGSIRYVHEACLEQWISRKRTSHCEVCTYPIQFEQVVQGSIGQGLHLLRYYLLLFCKLNTYFVIENCSLRQHSKLAAFSRHRKTICTSYSSIYLVFFCRSCLGHHSTTIHQRPFQHVDCPLLIPFPVLVLPHTQTPFVVTFRRTFRISPVHSSHVLALHPA